MRLIIILFFSASIFGQTNYPNDFISPLSIPIDVSGSFGELRSNHFHAGLDIKTNKKEGLDVFAVGDGFVSRIKISTFGYGKAIYITHPNGYVSVYGHLREANGAIEEYIKKQQYKQKSFEVEMFPSAGELPVKQGDIIAFSGNSGGSGGPHLHFEFRDSRTEKVINPLHFGFTKFVSDKREPFLQGIVAYPIDSVVVNKSQKPIAISFNKQADGTYLATKVLTNGKVGFGINAYDYCTNPYNKNGLYKVNAYLNGVLYYEYDFETFSFDESRYINNLIDYERYKGMKQRVQKLFHYSPYPLSVIKYSKNNGIINTQPNANYNYKIELFDYHGNKTTIIIPIEFQNQTITISKENNNEPYLLRSKVENNYTKENVSIYVPENAFYDDFKFDFEVKDGVLSFSEKDKPLQKNITVTFNNVEGVSEALLDKTFIASLEGHRLYYNKTYRKGTTFSTRVRDLDNYKLAVDTIAPRIYNVNFVEGKDLKNQKTLSVSIADNLSGIDTYNGYLNGEWILMEYDYKTKKLIHTLSDNKYVQGENDFKVVVTDNMQNSATFESHFFMNN
ncbi:M23 family metallopeptidase [Flavobacterium jejuense]|uniref:M23 family metallopeptidase n=1 Tax=Flavobacterium jejuense TaxID=1544455 RepID=A0ABX0ITP4_9FLAO|nr:M23 family metallopeptidase [Flavobacterium jejuense]NHN25209.1 M23 family metallopeptidase [Flavobacterium jejuense]